jgi:diguanylate cyclase (GGDEF)-like protein
MGNTGGQSIVKGNSNRPHAKRGLVACLFLLLAAVTVSAAPLPEAQRISANASELLLRADVLEDPTGELELAEVRAMDASFQPMTGIALPPSRSAWWLRISLLPEAGTSRDWFLLVGLPSLLDVQLHLPTAGGYQVYASGASMPQAMRVLPAWEPRFPLRLDEGLQTLYLRVMDPAELILPLRLVDEAALAQRDHRQATRMSLFLGLMVGLLVYNLFLYLSLLDSAYGWYVLSGTALLLCFLMITGWGGLYFWPAVSGFEPVARLFLPAVWGAAYWRFIAHFFRLDQGYPRLNRLLQVFSVLFVLVALWSLSGERFYSARVLHMLAIVALPFVFLIGILRWRDGFRPSAVLMLGQFALLLPIFTLALRVSGLIGLSPWVESGLLMGAAFETLLFAIALAQRIRGAESERDSALGLLLAERQVRLEQVEVHNAELEQRVADRTVELEQANSDLEEQRVKLAQEASQDNLTGLANRRALAQRFQLVSDLSDRNAGLYALLLFDLDGFKCVNDTAGHDAGDAVLKTLAQRLQALVRAGDTLARVGGDEFVVLMAQNASEAEARAFARRLIDAICQPIAFEERSHQLGASVGIALSVPGRNTLSEMMRLADTAMYAAKRGDTAPRIMLAAQS